MQDGQKKNLHTLTQTGMPVPRRNLQEPGCPPSVLTTQLPKFSGKFLPPSTGVCEWDLLGAWMGSHCASPQVPRAQPGLRGKRGHCQKIPRCEGALGAALWAAAREIGSAPTQTLKQTSDPALLQDLPSQ